MIEPRPAFKQKQIIYFEARIHLTYIAHCYAAFRMLLSTMYELGISNDSVL